MKSWLGLFAILLAVSGCAQSGFLGIDPGELKPSQFASSTPTSGDSEDIVGVSDGGLIGGGLGEGLNRKDHFLGLEAEYRALETTPAGDAVSWRNKKSGSAGTVTAFQPYRVGSQDCRQYSHSVAMRGGERSARGTACRNGDGTWIVLN